MTVGLRVWSMVVIAFALAGCTRKAKWEPILYSQDACHHCKMIISDKRFGAEFVTEKGKIYKFDAIECLGNYRKTHAHVKGSAFVADSFHEGQMIEFTKARFFHDPAVRSPMGQGIFAGASDDVLLSKAAGKNLMDYRDILKLIGQPELEGSL